LLAYHPIVVNGKVLLRLDARGNSYVVALDLKSGQRLWQVDYSRGLTGATSDGTDDLPWALSDAHAGLAQHAGVARYTLSARGHRAFARMGSPITVPSARRAGLWLTKDQGFLLGLDLMTEGKPLEGFPIRPPSNEWSFEGTPLADDGVFYVAMRRTEGARSQLYLAAFATPTASAPSTDELDETAQAHGKIKWRTRICSSATLMGGDRDELTHLLGTQDSGRLYFNTNAGAIAAVSADDGRLLWLLKYPRAPLRSASSTWPQRQLGRDLTPCLAWKDLVIVAPSDCDRVFALDATTGQIAWASPQGATDDMIHLLGVADGVLLASGDYLHWIDALTGKLLTQFPGGTLGGPDQAAPSPRGLGRGLIVGENVWWPTRDSIFVFAARPIMTELGWQRKLIREIPMLPRGATGGNLILAEGILLIATGDKLLAFGEQGAR
jgi:outer membrane protein assembly factor BamB